MVRAWNRTAEKSLISSNMSSGESKKWNYVSTTARFGERVILRKKNISCSKINSEMQQHIFIKTAFDEQFFFSAPHKSHLRYDKMAHFRANPGVCIVEFGNPVNPNLWISFNPWESRVKSASKLGLSHNCLFMYAFFCLLWAYTPCLAMPGCSLGRKLA